MTILPWNREAVITGFGVIAAVGAGKDAFWRGIINGNASVVEAMSPPASSFPKRSFYPAPDYTRDDPDASETFNLAMFACGEALADAGFDPTREDLAFYLGSGIGNLELIESLGIERKRKPRSFGTLAGDLAVKIGARTGIRHVSCECSSGLAALVTAADNIEAGRSDAVLVCGADAWSYVVQAMFNRGNVLDNGLAYPLMSGSGGLVLGEGAAAFLVEERNVALKRGRTPVAVVLKGCVNVDTFSPVASEPSGRRLADCIQEVIGRGWTQETDVVLSHASGLALADATEIAALRLVFGEEKALKILNVKHYVGHTVGASSLITLVAGFLAKKFGFIPPRITNTCNSGEPYPSGNRLLSIGYGIGGVNAAALLEAM